VTKTVRIVELIARDAAEESSKLFRVMLFATRSASRCGRRSSTARPGFCA
jgi:hypothetical protein